MALILIVTDFDGTGFGYTGFGCTGFGYAGFGCTDFVVLALVILALVVLICEWAWVVLICEWGAGVKTGKLYFLCRGFHHMQETFTLPGWFRIFCYVCAVVMLGMGAEMIYLEFTGIKGQNIIFFSFAFFFLAWSMYAYTRLRLVLDPQTVSFTGGWRPHHFKWTEITSIDMVRVGRYREAELIIRYGDRKLRLGRSFFRNKPFREILDRVERHAPAGVFTAGYRQIKAELPV